MARAKKAPEAGEVSGLALVDIQLVGAKSGDYVSLPAELAASLVVSGEFDTKAPHKVAA